MESLGALMVNTRKSGSSDDDLDRDQAALLRAQMPILAELCAAGYRIPSLWEPGGTQPTDAAIDVLVDHLQQAHPFHMRWAITNIISGDYAKRYFPLFVRLFKSDPDVTGFKAKSGIGGLIGQYCDASNLDVAMALLLDASHGESRVALLSVMLKRKLAPAINALNELADDPTMGGMAGTHLKRIAGRSRQKAQQGRKR